MKYIKSILMFMIWLNIFWCMINIAKPYWGKFCIERHVETAAIYGTKNSMEETREMLSRKIKEKGFDIEEEDIAIEKDEKNNVSINFALRDEINIFGVTLKKLKYDIEATAYEVRH